MLALIRKSKKCNMVNLTTIQESVSVKQDEGKKVKAHNFYYHTKGGGDDDDLVFPPITTKMRSKQLPLIS